MARPSKSAKVMGRGLSKKQIEDKIQAEESIRGGSSKLKPSAHLDTSQKKIFNFIVGELEQSGILGNLDIYILETCAIAIDRLQEIELLINRDINNLVNKGLMGAKDKYTKDLFKCCNELCLSPQSRARIGNINMKAEEDESDPLLKLLRGGKDNNAF
jgi:P27 family predicted phage terminase small subunit